MDRINVIDAKKYKQMLINGAPEGGEPNQKSSGWGFRATSPDNFTWILVQITEHVRNGQFADPW